MLSIKVFFLASQSETKLEATGHQQSVGKGRVTCHTRVTGLCLWGCRRVGDPAGDSETVVRSLFLPSSAFSSNENRIRVNPF